MSRTYTTDNICTAEFQTSTSGFSEIKDEQLTHETNPETSKKNILADVWFGMRVLGLLAKKAFFWPLNIDLNKFNGFFEFSAFLLLFVFGQFAVICGLIPIGSVATLSSFVFCVALIALCIWVPMQVYARLLTDGTKYIATLMTEQFEEVAEELRNK